MNAAHSNLRLLNLSRAERQVRLGSGGGGAEAAPMSQAEAAIVSLLQRGLEAPKVAAPATDSKPDPAARPAAEATAGPQAGPAAAPKSPTIGLSDTTMFRTRRVALEEARRDRERILPPCAIGSQGGAYKMLRTQVMRRLQELKANTLAVFSAAKGDGKTLTAINLAIAIAADRGHTALLVDLDLRNPSVHERLGLEPKVGFEDCLETGSALRSAMVKLEGYDRLTILPCRGRIEQSSELINSARMTDLMHELRTRYTNRILIFDLPPVLLADDALAFSHHVQAGLMVVAEGKTARADVTRSLGLLRNLTVVGTVLNRSRGSVGAYY
jgi:protein-tyrosine kinase